MPQKTTAAGGRTARTSPKEQRRLQHQDLSRHQLLDAAEEVFGRKGFHETTLKEIAEKADFSVGSVYSFFESKDDLFRQIFARRGAEYMPRMAAVLAVDEAPVRRLRHLVEFQIGFFREHPHFGRLYLRYSSATFQSDERLSDQLVRANYDESMVRQAALFAEGQAAGEFCDGDPTVLARMLSGLVAAFQAVDPVVLSDEPAPEPMPLEDFHRLVERTFRAPG